MRVEKKPRIHYDYFMFAEQPNALEQTFQSWIKTKGLILKFSSDHQKTGLKNGTTILSFPSSFSHFL